MAIEITMNTKQTSCKQCGICCTKGGPALHGKDINLIDQGMIPCKNLITIREREFAYNPVSDSIQATKTEIVKLKGTRKEWTCCYYDPESRGCTIYENRPMACEILKCWDPEDSLALVGTDLLSRFEIVRRDEALKKLITEYELACPLPDFEHLSEALLENPEKIIASLENLINSDLQFRNKAVANSEKILEEEMFLFGRPIFQLLQPFGLAVMQSGNKLLLMIQENSRK